MQHPRRSHSPVVIAVDEMIASAERNKVRVVGGRRNRDGARTANVRVAELIR